MSIHPETTGSVTMILTDDNGLLRAAAAILKAREWPEHTTAAVCQLRRNDYTGLCLDAVREKYEMDLRGEIYPRRIHTVPYYNYILKKMWSLPDITVSEIRDIIPGNWRKTVDCRLFYDVPNLERGLERTNYRASTNTVTFSYGGCLSRMTTDSLPWGKSWAEIPISAMKDWEDFSLKGRRTIHAKRVRIKGTAIVHRPERLASTRSITIWLNSQRKLA
jgi:hypothetical protein